MNYVEDLDKLLGICEKLYNQLVYIEKDNEFEDEECEIKQALRKLIIAEAVQKKHIICVTGLQNVGKTSLMQRYYGIDFEKMNISEARGEKIPVMISERKNCKDLSFFSVELRKDDNNVYSKVRLPITPEEFCERTKNISEDSEIMYVEMEVPYQHINNEYCSFLLLPGFEKRFNYWQDLINFAVKTSDVALFVTDQSSFASGENQTLMERIRDQFGPHSMICALTQTDLFEEQNNRVKIDIEKFFNLKDDQIILTGDYPNDTEKHKAWCDKLTNAIQTYNTNSNEKAVFDMISEIKNQVRTAISSIENKLDQKKIANNLGKYDIENELKPFDKQIRKIRKDWSKRLEGYIKTAEAESINYVLEKRANDIKEHAFKDWAKKAGRLIFGDNELDIKEQRDLLISSLKDNDIPKSTMAIVNSFFDDGDVTNYTCEYLLEDNSSNSGFGINVSKQKALMNNVNLLLRGKDAIDENGNQLEFSNDVSQSYEMLAEIAVYNYAKKYGQSIRNSCPDIVKNLKTPMPADLLKKMAETKKLGLGMFAMAGLDFLPDASFDAIAAMAEALSIPAGAMVGIFAGVMVVAGGVTLTRDINNMSRKQLMVAEDAIHAYYKNVFDTALTDFDEGMRRVRDLVAQNLACIQGADSNHFALINARSYVEQLKNGINELYQNMRLESKETKVAGLLTD